MVIVWCSRSLSSTCTARTPAPALRTKFSPPDPVIAYPDPVSVASFVDKRFSQDIPLISRGRSILRKPSAAGCAADQNSRTSARQWSARGSGGILRFIAGLRASSPLPPLPCRPSPTSKKCALRTTLPCAGLHHSICLLLPSGCSACN
eukprot:SAG31_NODE_17150_length_681_cov_1.321306_1_plen_148_part_00